MTVGDLKKRLGDDDDKMIIITDGKGWCNLDNILHFKGEVHFIQETSTVFDES